MAIWLDVCNRKFLKNLKVGVFETDFKQVPFVYQQTTCTYSESWGSVEKIFDTEKMTQKPKFRSKNYLPYFCLKTYFYYSKLILTNF